MPFFAKQAYYSCYIQKIKVLFYAIREEKCFQMPNKINFILNNEEISTSANMGMGLLDFIRKNQRLTGTKEGCREGDCGACTVLVGKLINDKIEYHSVNSCLMPLGDAEGKHIVTIEGFNIEELNPLQEAMVDEGGTQCGFCTPGFIVSMQGYFISNEEVNTSDAIGSIDGNICRCTGYAGIKRSADRIVKLIAENNTPNKNHLEELVQLKLLPEYFLTIPGRLKKINLEVKKNGKNGKAPDYFVSGGTDLYVQKWETMLESNIKLISSEKKYSGIQIEKDEIKIGGTTTVTEIMNSSVIQKYFPEITNQFKLFGSLPIRNRATLAGNIINASPIADMTNFFLALNSKIILDNGKKKRELFLKDFYKGYKTLDKTPDEILESLSFKIPSESSLFNYEKVSRRTYLDIASVNSSMYMELKDNKIIAVHISAGGVAPFPLNLAKTSDYLRGKNISDNVINEAIEIMLTEISPISDARGTLEYKTLLLRQLIYSHFIKFFPDVISLEEVV